jgi:hypothetical protein
MAASVTSHTLALVSGLTETATPILVTPGTTAVAIRAYLLAARPTPCKYFKVRRLGEVLARLLGAGPHENDRVLNGLAGNSMHYTIQ